MANNAENWGNQKNVRRKIKKLRRNTHVWKIWGEMCKNAKDAKHPPPAQVHPPVLGTGMQPTENRK